MVKVTVTKSKLCFAAINVTNTILHYTYPKRFSKWAGLLLIIRFSHIFTIQLSAFRNIQSICIVIYDCTPPYLEYSGRLSFYPHKHLVRLGISSQQHGADKAMAVPVVRRCNAKPKCQKNYYLQRTRICGSLQV